MFKSLWKALSPYNLGLHLSKRRKRNKEEVTPSKVLGPISSELIVVLNFIRICVALFYQDLCCTCIWICILFYQDLCCCTLYLNLYFMRQCNIYLSVRGAFCRQGRAGTGVMVAVIHALHGAPHCHTVLQATNTLHCTHHTATMHSTTLLCSQLPHCHTALHWATLNCSHNTTLPHCAAVNHT